eukprot:6042150-Amphidinium_carterae.1
MSLQMRVRMLNMQSGRVYLISLWTLSAALQDTSDFHHQLQANRVSQEVPFVNKRVHECAINQ